MCFQFFSFVERTKNNTYNPTHTHRHTCATKGDDAKEKRVFVAKIGHGGDTNELGATS